MSLPNPSRTVKFTYEDYLLFPEDGKRHELIDGEHYMTPAPSLKHQIVVQNLSRTLGQYVYERKLGRLFVAPVDVVLSDVDVVQPDLLFVSKANASRLTEKHVRGAPDLVVEVLSEVTRKTDERIKRKLYEKYGVTEYWVVDPELEGVKVFRLTPKGYERAEELGPDDPVPLRSPLFPDLEIPLRKIFE